MNFYTLAAKLNKQITKDYTKMMLDNNCDTFNEELYNKALNNNIKQFESNCRLGIQLMMKFKEIAIDEGLTPNNLVKQTYFITIRPDTSSITFYDFYNKVSEYLNRKCFIEYTCSFEQKGTCNETIGTGFHVHIIAKMKQRSKGEVLRDTQRTFKNSTSANCIQVDVLKSEEDLHKTKSYILEYTSDDGHKMPTKEWDEAWRLQWGLQSSYQNSTGPLPAIKSGAGSIRIREITADIPL